MKINLALSILLLLAISCKKDHAIHTEPFPSHISSAPSSRSFASMLRYSGADYSQAISIDTANKMIESYLKSVNYPNRDTCLRSLSFDADTLRSYLNDTSHGRIVTLKFVLAHRMDYINGGNSGVNCGTKGDALTLILVGLSENDNYIYNDCNKVYEHFQPCPDHCAENSVAVLTQ